MYNIRVYGLLIKNNHVLVSDEFYADMLMTKFPGGGHQIGESLPQCLQREFEEELNLKINIEEHFYTTDFYVSSIFNKAQQLIGIYYFVKNIKGIDFKTSVNPYDFEKVAGAQSLRWLPINELKEEDFTFVIDKKVALMLKNKFTHQLF